MAGAWGQGEHSAAGYEDHGSSELTYAGGQLLGALETIGPAGYPASQSVEIPAEEWIDFFNSFSRQHQGWIADITVRCGSKEWVGMRECRIEGVSSDHLTARDEIYLSMSQSDHAHVTHTIQNPLKVVFRQDARGAHEGLEITSADGTLTSLRFRVAAVPDTLDGVLHNPVDRHDPTQPPQKARSESASVQENVRIQLERSTLEGVLSIPADARGVVLFAPGSGSSRHRPRNRHVADVLQSSGLATLLMDLLTPQEEAIDEHTSAIRFDIELLASRLAGATWWLVDQSRTSDLPIGYFGASTASAAALLAAADQSDLVSAVVSQGGRPDLAGTVLNKVITPTLLIVGGNDAQLIRLNQTAIELMPAPKRLEIVPGATHLFEEPGALESVATLARDWFLIYLSRAAGAGRAA